MSNLEETFCQHYGGTEQEFMSGGILYKRNVAGYVIGTGYVGTAANGHLDSGILFDPAGGDPVSNQVSLARILSAKMAGANVILSWSKGSQLSSLLVPLRDVIQPPGSPIITVTVQLDKPLEFIHMEFTVSPPIDLARYPQKCPKCAAPAYLGLRGWDCSKKC